MKKALKDLGYDYETYAGTDSDVTHFYITIKETKGWIFRDKQKVTSIIFSEDNACNVGFLAEMRKREKLP